MKRRAVSFFTAVFLTVALAFPAAARSERVSVTEYLTGQTEEEGDDRIKTFIEGLPDEISEELPEGLGEDISDDDASKFGISYFVSLVLKIVRTAFAGLFAPLAALLGAGAAAFIVRTFVSSRAARGAASFVIKCAVCVTVLECGVIGFDKVSSYLSGLASVSQTATPVCLAMLVSCGRVSAAGVSASLSTGVAALCEKVFSGAVMPMICASFAVTLAEAALPDGAALPLSSFIRKAAVWITVATSSLASFIFAVQSLLANAADTVGLKTVRFAIGAFIPFVGGAVADTAGAISAGASSVKTFFGAVLMTVLAILLLSPLVSLFAGKIALGIAKVFFGILGGSSEMKIFDSLSETVNCLIAVVASSGAVFMVIAAVFASYGALI